MRLYQIIHDEFRFDFDLSQAIKQHEYTKTQKSREVIK